MLSAEEKKQFQESLAQMEMYRVEQLTLGMIQQVYNDNTYGMFFWKTWHDLLNLYWWQGRVIKRNSRLYLGAWVYRANYIIFGYGDDRPKNQLVYLHEIERFLDL
ncbi:MAG: hypothetical protein ACK5MY_02620 [Jhaorihella sp.]